MFAHQLILIIIIGKIYFNDADSHPILGGWTETSEDRYVTEMVNLANEALRSNVLLASKSIRVVNCYVQIVSGLNLRLNFIVGEEQNCTLIAYKPLPYTKKPIEVTSLKCNTIISDNDNAEIPSYYL